MKKLEAIINGQITKRKRDSEENSKENDPKMKSVLGNVYPKHMKHKKQITESLENKSAASMHDTSPHKFNSVQMHRISS